jgi:Flp pilus assembly protein TadB
MKAEKRRLIMAGGWTAAHPVIQAAMAGGMDINTALRFVAENCPPAIDEISAHIEASLAAGHKFAHTGARHGVNCGVVDCHWDERMDDQTYDRYFKDTPK